jgi:hypothetical protein
MRVAVRTYRSEKDTRQMTRRSLARPHRKTRTAPFASTGTPTVDALEQRVLAFAEQLGRVRDGAAELIQQLTAQTRRGRSR